MASRKFKYVNHTADVEFVAMGKNLEECFANAFLALFDTICYTKKVAASKQKEVKNNHKRQGQNH
jgi:SHS2 domain-containing protein